MGCISPAAAPGGTDVGRPEPGELQEGLRRWTRSLRGLFGGGDDAPQRQQQAQDFVNRYEQGPIDQGYSAQEAFQHFQNVAQNADPATIQQAAEQTFTRMDPAQRQQFAQQLQQQMGGQADAVSADPGELAGMMAQVQQQNPGGLASLFGGGGGGGGGLGGLLGGGGFPGGTVGKVVAGGIAAYAMKQMLGGHGGGDSGGRSV